jgi:hypothetical protein
MVAITLQQFSLYTSVSAARTLNLKTILNFLNSSEIKGRRLCMDGFNGADRYWYCGCSNLATTFDEELVQRNTVVSRTLS